MEVIYFCVRLHLVLSHLLWLLLIQSLVGNRLVKYPIRDQGSFTDARGFTGGFAHTSSSTAARRRSGGGWARLHRFLVRIDICGQVVNLVEKVPDSQGRSKVVGPVPALQKYGAKV